MSNMVDNYGSSKPIKVSEDIFYVIERDIDPQSPEFWDNVDVFLASNYRKFSVREDFLDMPFEDVSEEYWILPFYLTDHSGLHLSLSSPAGHCWDTSQPGYVYVSRNDWDSQNKAEKAGKALLEEWNFFLSGDVWGYRVMKNSVCTSCGHNDPEELDSCWGIYGWDSAQEEALRVCTACT